MRRGAFEVLASTVFTSNIKRPQNHGRAGAGVMQATSSNLLLVTSSDALVTSSEADLLLSSYSMVNMIFESFALSSMPLLVQVDLVKSLPSVKAFFHHSSFLIICQNELLPRHGLL